MNNIETIEHLTEKLLDETPQNVHSVGYGFKEVDGQLTDELSIIFSVTDKKPLSALSSDEILPSTVTAEDGTTISTDVIQVPKVQFTDCYTDSDSIEPVSLHRVSRSNYLGGIRVSIDNPENLGSSAFVGTMGLICKDLTDNTLVGLTNAHVAALTPTLASLQLSSFDNKQTTLYQALPWANQTTMKLKRYMPFSTTNNTTDAAVLAITNPSTINTSTTFKQLNLNYGNVEFATTSEINNLVTNRNPIFKAGATTGPVGWPGSSPWGSEACSLTATQIGVSVDVDYGTVIRFTSCIVYRGTTTVASKGGDSGSAVCALINPSSTTLSAWKVVGLTFAGVLNPTDNSPSYACRIDNVCTTLQLTSWDGQTTNLTNLNNEKVKYIVGKSSVPYFDEDGKRYWQTGLTII